jgi:hypothetical protein
MDKKAATKRIGIGVDNYKVRNFKRALIREGYAYNQTPLAGATFIYFDVDEKKFNYHVQNVGKICKKLEIDFKQSN